MRHTRFTPTAVGLGLLLATLPCTRLHATTLVMMADEDLVHGSTAIVVGQVVSIRTTAQSTSRIETEIDLVVETQVVGAVSQVLTLVIPGGTARGVQRVIFGAPQFFRGERVLVFLRARGDGRLAVTGLGMGKYSIVSSAAGDVARRQLGGPGTSVSGYDKLGGALAVGTSSDIRPLDDFLHRLRQIVAAEPTTVPPVAAMVVPDLAGSHRVSDPFTLLGSRPARWTEADHGDPVAYRVVPGGDATLGFDQSMQAVSAALAAWSQADSRIRLVNAGDGDPAPFDACDGVSTIQFNDPFGEIGAPVNCGGVLAMGGYCVTLGSTSTLDGVTFDRILEGDLTINDGFGGCRYWNASTLAETITHELGHTIGLGHSSENPQEPNPVLKDAAMYYKVHGDGRGASLRADDRAGVQALYPRRATEPRRHPTSLSPPSHLAPPRPIRPPARLGRPRIPRDE